MRYQNPQTGETRLLGGSNVNAQARELEAAGWQLVHGEPVDEMVPARELEAAVTRIADLEAELARAKAKIRRLSKKDAESGEKAGK